MRFIAWCALGLAGLLSFLVQSGEVAAPLPPDLDRIPERLGTLSLQGDIPFDVTVLGELPPERWLFQQAVDSDTRRGLLYVAYFERGRRWSGRPHPVEVCYYAQGWEELEAQLIVALAGAAVSHAVGVELARDPHLLLGEEGAGERRAQQIRALVHRVGLERGVHEVAHELLAKVRDHAVLRAGSEGLLDDLVQVFVLADVSAVADDLGAVRLDEPPQDD